MEGDILTTNAPMLHFMRALGFSVEASEDGPEIRRVHKRLAPATPAAAQASPERNQPA